MKKKLLLSVAAMLFLFMVSSCGSDTDRDTPASDQVRSDKLQIVATLFPQYDFVRQIAGEHAEVILLLPPGVESHSYEPTPSDMITIAKSDLFLYTGEYMEPWADKIIRSVRDTGSSTIALDASDGIELVRSDEDEDEPDPHIWTDPINAEAMVRTISNALCEADPANAEQYRKNAEAYTKKLDALDAEFQSIMSSGKRHEILFGSRFALYYFAQRYDIDWEAAFDSCSSETEPSAKTVAGLIQKIRDDKIPVIYYAELEDPKVARAISEETGAKMLMFHSCHNVTREELENGATYLSLMEQNAANLKEGLN